MTTLDLTIAACDLLTAEVHFTVHGEPVSKARARFTRYGSKTFAYTPEHTKTGEAKVAAAFLASGGRHDPDPNAAFGIRAHFYAGTRQRRDVDNMLKLVLDGLNRVAWIDDAQVIEISGKKSWVPKSEARTTVEVYRVGINARLMKACVRCGEDFETWPSLYEQVHFCSAKCRTASRIAARTATCERCGTEFLRHGPANEQRYCSKECSYASRRREVSCTHCAAIFTKQLCHVRATNYCSDVCAKANARDKARANRANKRSGGTCTKCGGWVSKPQYLVCRACKARATGAMRTGATS